MTKLTRQEYMDSNKFIRKGMANLDKEDLSFLADVGGGKINPNDINNKLRFRQVVLHMTTGMNIWEMHQLLKAFKFLMKL